jgi:hypothetical protein
MPVSRFDEHLPLLLDDKEEQVGICLMGPIGNGETLVWMSGWAWQQDGEDVIAASTGDAGVPVKGAHPPEGIKEDPPFGPGDGKWMIQTGFRDRSAPYDPKKPVLVQALALMEKGNETAIVQWSQAVKIEHAY